MNELFFFLLQITHTESIGKLSTHITKSAIFMNGKEWREYVRMTRIFVIYNISIIIIYRSLSRQQLITRALVAIPLYFHLSELNNKLQHRSDLFPTLEEVRSTNHKWIDDYSTQLKIYPIKYISLLLWKYALRNQLSDFTVNILVNT